MHGKSQPKHKAIEQKEQVNHRCFGDHSRFAGFVLGYTSNLFLAIPRRQTRCCIDAVHYGLLFAIQRQCFQDLRCFNKRESWFLSLPYANHVGEDTKRPTSC
jgi:hypothetical protein